MDIDLKQLKELMRALKQFDIAELEIEKNGERIKLSRSSEAAAGSLLPAAIPSVHMPLASFGAPAAPTLAPPGRIAGAPFGVEGAPATLEEGDVHFVTSPFVGTFYPSPSPSAEPFVQVGSEVKAGQTLCIVEAMKLMNEIESDVSGVVVEVLGGRGKPVEYGERLFKIKKRG
jgi:acetyl-CoA carboxylase biotin carboxyl carrier protein